MVWKKEQSKGTYLEEFNKGSFDISVPIRVVARKWKQNKGTDVEEFGNGSIDLSVPIRTNV